MASPSQLLEMVSHALGFLQVRREAMSVLSLQQVFEAAKTHDADSITYLNLKSKSFSDVSCLSQLRNLEKLDLSGNNLTSLEGLKSCTSLKWLSVVQNKLQSLNGIEGLTNLNVLNAGRNKLKSMYEVRSIVSLRALILNDNEIATICKLDQMKELNTLVLSKNPIRKIGESLVKVKSLTKLSMSHCQVEAIESLKSCTELNELRLAHNDIKTLPSELAHNSKLQLLDVGNNLITRWSDLKVLSSLVELKNLNLLGNPIAEKDKLAAKMRKQIPNLQIFNAKPIDKFTKTAKADRPEKMVEFSLNVQKEDDGTEKGLKRKSRKILIPSEEEEMEDDEAVSETKPKKKSKKVLNDQPRNIDDIDSNAKKESSEITNSIGEEKEVKRKPKRVKEDEFSAIDDSETPFAALIENSGGDAEKNRARNSGKAATSGLVAVTVQTKKGKRKGMSFALQMTPAVEVGLGGESTWDD